MLIRVNLLGERKKKGANTLLWLSLYGASVLLCCAVFFVMLTRVGSELADKESQVGLLEAQLAKLRVVTKEVRELDAKKKSLAEKIAVMAALKKKKAGPVHVMDDLNSAVPDKAWIVELKELDGALLRITGFALDNQTIAGFMKALEDSDYFSDVDLVETKQALVKGVGIKEFILQSKINYLGKIIADQTPIVLPGATDAAVAPASEKSVAGGAPS